jgi:hypothetical protein
MRMIWRAVHKEQGTALITAIMMLSVLSLFLVGFQALNQSELFAADYSRSSMLALNLAEAGAQEAFERMKSFGYVSGTSTWSPFTTGLASTVPGATATVTVQNPLGSNVTILPVLSVATVNGVTRHVRLLVNGAPDYFEYQISGNIVNFDGNTNPSSGNDIYSTANVEFENWPYSPLCAATATALNLVSPQVLAGTLVYAESPAANQAPPCGAPNNAGTYFAECQDLQNYFLPIQSGGNPSGSLPTGGAGKPAIGEVAPTSCMQDGGRATSNTAGGMSPQAMGSSFSAPVNWHPLTPIAMTSTDFKAVVAAWQSGTLPSQVVVAQATQTNATGTQTAVTYTPAGTYTPSYWTTYPSINHEVLVIGSTQPFCVNSSTGSVTATSTACAAGSDYYGFNGNINNSSGGSADDTGAFPTRFLDEGLITDDLNRGTPVTFFGTGNQNGIRYIPAYMDLPVLSYACHQNVNPGTNVFDNVNGAAVSCSNPPTTTINSQNVTFSGTQSSPESLIISNNTGGGQVVQITGSVSGQSSGTSCTGINPGFGQGNWGYILATGDIQIDGNFVFTGYIYVQGNVSLSSGSQYVWLNGGLIDEQTTTPSNTGNLDFANKSSFVGLCGGQAPQISGPLFNTYSQVSWQDVPLNQP